MTRFVPGQPEESEYAQFYRGYVSLVPEADVLAALKDSHEVTRLLLSTVEGAREQYRYAEQKWSIREVAGHLIDAERVMAYRALVFARGDRVELPGFDEQQYVPASRADEQPLPALLEELTHLRRSSILMFERLDGAGWRRSGVANGSPVSVRALAHIIAGHNRHHLGVLQEKYGLTQKRAVP